MEILIKVSVSFVSFLLEASPFMLLGLFFAGILKAFLPDDFVKKHIGSHKKGGIFKASAFGIPIPLCSCGVVPAAAGIRKQGAGKGPVVSFLVSTPETGVDSIAITWAMLGPVMAVIRPVAAFITALFTGILVNLFDKDQKDFTGDEKLEIEGCHCHSCGDSGGSVFLQTHDAHNHGHDHCGCSNEGALGKNIFSKFKSGMQFAFIELTGDISAWFLGGVLFAAVIAAFISPEMVHSVSSRSPFLIMFFMMVISVPLYVCATSSTPIAAAFLLTGVSPGAALVFLLAGPATNAASFSVISRIIGKKSAFIYLAGIIISSLVIGLATDYAFSFFGYTPVPSAGEIGEGIGYYLELVSLIVLLAVFIYPLMNKLNNRLHFIKKTQ